VPLNVFNKTSYLIYSLNNLYLLSLRLTKKKNLNICHLNVIHMRITVVCIYFATICLLSVSDLFLCNYSHIFLCFSRYTVVCPVCIKHHSCTWLGISLIPNIYIILTAVTHLLITKFILKLAGICGFCNVNICT